ncbi:MAG: antibiotic biosynthesis monooxygenase [Chloroflexi bacterium]|nr:antibiotic biosynthesis monooxygenase [Chloroflexota bacterium]
MPYIRLSIARPRKGEEQRLEQLMRQLNELAAENPACLETFLLRPHDDSGEVARIAVYKDENSAEHAANSDRVLALRSEMHLASEAGHVERAFFSV